MKQSLEERIRSRIAVDSDTGCWEWQGTKIPSGYGMLTFEGVGQPAHRWAWMVFRGPIAKGLELDHLCRNRGCANPEHLELVTHAENMRRGHFVSGKDHPQGKKTHCPRGHPYAGANLYVRKGRRFCRACQASSLERFRARYPNYPKNLDPVADDLTARQRRERSIR